MALFNKIIEDDISNLQLTNRVIFLRILRVFLEFLACQWFPKDELKRFLPTLCFSCGIIILLVACQIAYKTVLTFRNLSQAMWVNNARPKRICKIVSRYRKISATVLYFMYVLSIIGNITWHFAGGQKQTISLVYIRKRYTYLYYYVLFIEMCLLQASIHTGLCFNHVMIDTVLGIFEQIYLYANSIETNIILSNASEYEQISTNYIRDQFYQRHVYEELRKIYYEQIKVVRMATIFYQSTVTKLAGGLAQIVGVSMIPIIVSCSVHFSKIKMIVILICIIFLGSTTIVVYFNLGQIYSDQVSRIYDLFCNMHWYIWSVQNRESYIILLTRIRFVDSLFVGFNTPVNRCSVIKYVKLLYTALAFLYNTNTF